MELKPFGRRPEQIEGPCSRVWIEVDRMFPGVFPGAEAPENVLSMPIFRGEQTSCVEWQSTLMLSEVR